MGSRVRRSGRKRCVVKNNAEAIGHNQFLEIANWTSGAFFAEDLAGVGGCLAFVFVLAIDKNVDALL